jgi:hypothetical protein
LHRIDAVPLSCDRAKRWSRSDKPAPNTDGWRHGTNACGRRTAASRFGLHHQVSIDASSRVSPSKRAAARNGAATPLPNELATRRGLKHGLQQW